MLPQQTGGCQIFPQIQQPVAFSNGADLKLLECTRNRAAVVMGNPGFRNDDAFQPPPPGAKSKICILVVKWMKQVIESLHINEPGPIHCKRAAQGE